jgi:hypothetical protein
MGEHGHASGATSPHCRIRTRPSTLDHFVISGVGAARELII